MSSLIVEVCEVAEVAPHPNADRMAVARIKGWQVCVAKDAATGEAWCKPGDRVVYFPPDAVLGPDVAERLGVSKYLGALPKREDGTRPPGGRVMVASLRGFRSYGFVAPPDDPAWAAGTDVAAHYGVSKWEPPLRANQGDAETPHPAFHRYYDMENIRNFPDAFADGEEIAVVEKLHGQNSSHFDFIRRRRLELRQLLGSAPSATAIREEADAYERAAERALETQGAGPRETEARNAWVAALVASVPPPPGVLAG